ncbi:excinuclease ABC subunit UvrC [Fimbriimonas ginsengisoli]|uniref:UvrABC system protein C n=1 Tax=Fimbriimonas ginsengisoli Gsoil 348 TaxID=661478 RepID=A0A068NXD1_FIMGI|nr:excinuclease ABC subunit UvrC [Fimbriimonas ginsengisoli]AIE86294.1 excinuclease ABC, C subunit [Fimbriimonas ginsengisoli Gsoil 348]
MAKRNNNEAVQEKLKLVPAQPGCYIYKDEHGSVLYVGKAILLRNRVRSYFQSSAKHGPRIDRLVRKVCDIEWIVVDTEIEALVLECNLIKQHRPPFNVRMRDDKSYPYITVTDEKFPRVMFTRRVRKDKAKYFGPYPSAYAVRDTLQLLHKTFPLIPCGKSWTGEPVQRPCLYYHLGRCLGPCAGLSDRAEYGKILDKVERFLGGKEEMMVEDLKKEMEAAAEELDFEKAAKIRDQLNAIQTVLSRQKVLNNDQIDQDVIAVVKDDRGAAIQMLYIRGGKLIGQRQFVLDGASEAQPSEAVGEFVKQYYADSPDVPREILLPMEIEERGIVQTWLRQRKGSAVTVEVPQTGEKARLVDMAAANAEQALAQFAQELEQKEVWAEEAMGQLQDSLGLDMPPIRIEGYDISNIQGTAPVGSMVVTENGEAAKDEYRRFKIRYHPESPNDFAMMHEVLTRRLKAYVDGDEKFQKLPDLIMVDGGKGQLAAALKARDDLGLTVPMVGLAKRHELIYVPVEPAGELLSDIREMEAALAAPPPADTPYSYDRPAPKTYGFREVELPLTSPGLMLLRKLRDEAHRFALTYHRKLRDKKFGGSSLDEIPGVGPRRKRLLLRTFGSVEGIRRATADELAAVPTMTKALAVKVKDFLAEL